MIKVTCERCGESIKARDEAAGKRFKCPTCGVILRVPEPAPTYVPLERPRSADRPAPRSATGQWSRVALAALGAVALVVVGFLSAWLVSPAPGEPETEEGKRFRAVEEALANWGASRRIDDKSHRVVWDAKARFEATKYDAYGPHWKRLLDASFRYQESPAEIGFNLHGLRKSLGKNGIECDFAALIDGAIRVYDESPNRTLEIDLGERRIQGFSVIYEMKRKEGLDHEETIRWMIVHRKI